MGRDWTEMLLEIAGDGKAGEHYNPTKVALLQEEVGRDGMVTDEGAQTNHLVVHVPTLDELLVGPQREMLATAWQCHDAALAIADAGKSVQIRLASGAILVPEERGRFGYYAEGLEDSEPSILGGPDAMETVGLNPDSPDDLTAMARLVMGAINEFVVEVMKSQAAKAATEAAELRKVRRQVETDHLKIELTARLPGWRDGLSEPSSTNPAGLLIQLRHGNKGTVYFNPANGQIVFFRRNQLERAGLRLTDPRTVLAMMNRANTADDPVREVVDLIEDTIGTLKFGGNYYLQRRSFVQSCSHN